MTENRLDFLKSAFPDFEVRISNVGTDAVILNPFCDESVNVYYYEEDDFTPFVASFSFQHRHLTDEEDVIEWINAVISGKKLAIEFFQDGKRRFGGDISAEEVKNLSYQKLEQYTGYFGMSRLLKVADSFKVRGWNPKSNFDAVFVFETDGRILIRKAAE